MAPRAPQHCRTGRLGWPGVGCRGVGEALAGEQGDQWNKCLGLQDVKRVLGHLREQPGAPKA